MAYLISPKKLIESDMFVKEPVDDVCKKIEESNSKRIILTGTRGSGKSVVLANLQKRNNDTLLMHFDQGNCFDKEPNQFFNNYFFDSFYELQICERLLFFIKNKYEREYNQKFKKIHEEIPYYIEYLNDYINNYPFNESLDVDDMIKRKEISKDILQKMRNELEIEKINLAIPNIDRINGCSKYVQNLLSDYFDMFDKVVLEVHDEKLNRKKLKEKGYDFQRVNYGYRKDIIKAILLKRITHYNSDKEKSLEELGNPNTEFYDLFIPRYLYRDDKIIKEFKKTHGDIKLAIDSLFTLEDLRKIKGNMTPETVDSAIEAEKEKILVYKQTWDEKDKLYL